MPALPTTLFTTPEVAAGLHRFRQLVRSTFADRLREVTVFGSRARGYAREDSDVDLLVVVDGLSESERGEVFDLAWRAAMAGEEYVVLAPIPYSSERATELRWLEQRLMREVDSQGIPLGRVS